MNPPCPDCGSDSKPLLDRWGVQMRMDPQHCRYPKTKLPVWECVADGTLFFAHQSLPDMKRQSAGEES